MAENNTDPTTLVPIPTPTDLGTIDITNLVENLRSTFVTLAKNYLMALALAIPGLGWFALWLEKIFLSPLLQWILDKLTLWEVMQAFFLNTAIRKASQAADYVDSINFKNNLPTTATDEEYENAEAAEMHSFYNFVLLVN